MPIRLPLPVTRHFFAGVPGLLLCACLGTPAPAAVADEITFANETNQSLDQIADSSYRFDAMWTDFNSDGCYDAWIFDHANPATSRLWVNRCDGSQRLDLIGNDQVHYYIADPELPRGSGWVTLLDINGDARQDFWTRDANTLAAYYINGTPGIGAAPYFASKEAACDEHCVLADINGDDRFDIVHVDRSIEDALDHRPLGNAEGPKGDRTAADLDGDGWVDLVQASAGGYWHNNHGSLEWRAIAGLTGNTDLVLVEDFDNDGDFDLFTVGSNNGQHGGRLFRNDGNGHFTDVTASSGVATIGFIDWWTGYSNTIAADFDNDGRQDILVAGDTYSPGFALLRNLGGMKFARANFNLGAPGTGSESYKARASVADFDNDGRLDILKTQVGTNAGIWRNTTSTGTNRWMKVRVRGNGLNSDGVGADLKWYAAGTTTLIAHQTVQVSNQHPQTWLHTGVGDHAAVDLVVSWPHGGPARRFDNLSTNQEVIAFPSGCLIQHWLPGNGWPKSAPADCGKSSQCKPDATPETVTRTIRPLRAESASEALRAAAVAAGKLPPVEEDTPDGDDCDE